MFFYFKILNLTKVISLKCNNLWGFNLKRVMLEKINEK